VSEKSQIAKLDYENVDLMYIEDILRMHLPKLKEKISLAKKFLQAS